MMFIAILVLLGTIAVLVLLLKRFVTKHDQASASLREMTGRFESASLELEKYIPIRDLQAEVARRSEELTEIKKSADFFKTLLDEYEVEVDLHEMSYYQPKFNLDGILQYEQALEAVREAEKELVASRTIFVESGDDKKNRELGKLALSALNGDATAIIESVTYSNFEKSKEKLRATFNKINNLLVDTGLQVAPAYLDLKVKEMALVFDHLEAERKIREEQIELKEMMREEEKARRESEEARDKAIRDQERYHAALEQVRKEMAEKSDDERRAMEGQIGELQRKLEEATTERERATSMAQITKKGHVYIISNIGSFGERVLKIGMTRRRDPQERIIELGDASVPLSFDIHAMVYSDDAPSLESTMHREFEARRMNKINLRKEFFRISVDEVAQACEKLGYRIHLTKLAEAREYRETLAKEAGAGDGGI